jgi:hypothetical protein
VFECGSCPGLASEVQHVQETSLRPVNPSGPRSSATQHIWSPSDGGERPCRSWELPAGVIDWCGTEYKRNGSNVRADGWRVKCTWDVPCRRSVHRRAESTMTHSRNPLWFESSPHSLPETHGNSNYIFPQKPIEIRHFPPLQLNPEKLRPRGDRSRGGNRIWEPFVENIACGIRRHPSIAALSGPRVSRRTPLWQATIGRHVRGSKPRTRDLVYTSAFFGTRRTSDEGGGNPLSPAQALSRPHARACATPIVATPPAAHVVLVHPLSDG